MSGVEVLKRQHEQLLEALEELEVTVDEQERVRLLAHIGQRLKAHAAVEEEVFYPTVAASGGKGRAAVAEALEAHQGLDVLLDEMIGTDISAARVKVLRDLARRHFEAEESALLPIAEQLDDAARRRLDHAIDEYLDEYGDGAEDTLPV